MKYMLLLYSNPVTWGHLTYIRTPEAVAMPAGEREEMVKRADALMAELVESGELAGGQTLPDPAGARTVRVRRGTPTITDGPFVESKEQFAGYLIVGCAGPERAAEIAARVPDARFVAVEIRPLGDD